MRAVLCGANGAMGKLIDGLMPGEIVGRVSIDGENGVPKTFDELGVVEADLIIDFSHHTAISDVLSYARKIGCGVVVGTTGHTAEEKALIYEAAKELPVFYSGNMSLGIAVLCRLAKEAARYFPDADIEIVETHHNRKVDAPSGTALMLAKAVREARGTGEITSGRTGHGKRQPGEIGVQSVRMGNVVGIHEIHINTGTQTLTLRHEAHDRALFAEGAMTAAAWLVGKEPGLYDMDDLMKENG